MSTTRLPKNLEKMVSFANWCLRHKLEPFQGAELIRLCDLAAQATIADSNCTNEDRARAIETRMNNSRKKVREKAESLGFLVVEYSVWPTFSTPDYSQFGLPT